MLQLVFDRYKIVYFHRMLVAAVLVLLFVCSTAGQERDVSTVNGIKAQLRMGGEMTDNQREATLDIMENLRSRMDEKKRTMNLGLEK